VALYFFISRTFGDAAAFALDGAPTYFAFATVGAALATVFQAATVTLAMRVREEQLTGTLEALAAQPLTTSELSLGFVGYPFLLATIRGAVILALASLLPGFDFSETSWIGFFLVLLATGAAMTSLGIALAALVLVLKRAQAIVATLLSGLALLSGAYFPTSVLPGWLEPLSTIIPLRLAFDAVRAAVFRGEGWLRPTLLLVLTSVVFLPFALWIFARALALTKRRGSLAQY
jgi:ABC-2 type transport system permease protein